jgi:23S rRNA pseudouridine2605 synthase
MRLNKYIAQTTGISRRAADAAIANGEVLVNGQMPSAGHAVTADDIVRYRGRTLVPPQNSSHKTIMLNKPVGYICSRDGQGGRTIYDILPSELHALKPVGRLDKNSSGLLLMTTDGTLAHSLTHPSFAKSKIYKIALNRPLSPEDETTIQSGVTLDDGISQLELTPLNTTDRSNWKVAMSEGRNRQIRRTFDALNYRVVKLHRTHFGNYVLTNLKPGEFRLISNG